MSNVNNQIWSRHDIAEIRMVDIGPEKLIFFKMNAETCFTPKSFLLVLKFIECNQII